MPKLLAWMWPNMSTMSSKMLPRRSIRWLKQEPSAGEEALTLVAYRMKSEGLKDKKTTRPRMKRSNLWSTLSPALICSILPLTTCMKLAFWPTILRQGTRGLCGFNAWSISHTRAWHPVFNKTWKIGCTKASKTRNLKHNLTPTTCLPTSSNSWTHCTTSKGLALSTGSVTSKKQEAICPVI